MVNSEQLGALLPKAEQLTADLSQEEFNHKLSPGTWSVGECLAHLNVTNELYAGNIANAVGQGRSAGKLGHGPFRPSLLERAFIWMLEPPVRLRFKAPAAFSPPSELDKAEVLARWRHTHIQLLALAEASRDLHLSAIKVQSPVNSRLKLSLGATFAVTAAHDRRHLWQAQRVKHQLKQLDGPP